MTDPHVALISHLGAVAAVTALTGSRIYAGVFRPPSGYTPAAGSALTIQRRGMFPSYAGDHLEHSMQLAHYGRTAIDAQALYSAVYAALDLQTSAALKYSRWEAGGDMINDPTTGFPFVIAYYVITIPD